MKKTFFISLAAAAFFLFTGASVWEGAAAVSGDFPEEGLYVATNAFPRNTVVDLTNLETGKTVRVIVSAGLDTPGLLALVSREAAVAVGLQSRTIGRIRMIQPSDPIAFSRFTEDHLRSGDPDYDPLAAIEGAYPGGSAGANSSPAEAVSPAAAAPAAAAAADPAVDPAADPAPEEAVPAVSEPVIAAVSSGPPVQEIIPEPPPLIKEEPVLAVREPEKDPERITPSETPELLVPAAVEDSVETTETPVSRNGAGGEPVLSDIPREFIPAPEEQPEPPALISAPVLIPVPVPVPVPVPAAPAAEGASGPAPAPSPEPPTGAAGGYGYTLVPAEERVPQSSAGASGSVPQIFSVLAVSDLEYGKYYLQIGAYSQVAAVERELAKVNKAYPLAVQCTGSSGRPVYRILVGPVNQGESGALLKSFQSMGYTDAFVRRGN